MTARYRDSDRQARRVHRTLDSLLYLEPIRGKSDVLELPNESAMYHSEIVVRGLDDIPNDEVRFKISLMQSCYYTRHASEVTKAIAFIIFG